MSSCLSGVSWEEARVKCENAGARLCTIEELENDIPRGTGCGYDWQMVWSTTPCQGGVYINSGRYQNTARY